MKFYDLVSGSLEKVEKHMEKTLSSNESSMYPLILEYLKRGGKRIRPALVLLVLKSLGGDLKDGVEPAAILEMFHNFTLIHDDVEDNSLLRRGKPTMHKAEGIPIAINAGDALYTLVWKSLFQLDLPLKKKNELGLLLSGAFKKVVEGQHIELKWYREKVVDISEQDYFNMISGKTGSLIQASCELGVLLSPNTKFRKQFSDYGISIGIAFQIQDDILNLIGKEKDYKKEIGGDITEGKRTLMLAHALQNLDKRESQELKSILLSNTKDQNEIKRAIELIIDAGGIDYAKNKAVDLIRDSKASMESVPDSVYKSALLDLADFILNRAH